MELVGAIASKDSVSSSRLIKIRIKRNDGSWFAVEADQNDTILSLKKIIFEKTSYYPEQQRLVFAGKVMDDEKSLSFYKIRENSQVYLVPKKTPNIPPKQVSSNFTMSTKPKPTQLLNRLIVLLESFPNVRAEDYTSTILEIKEIINDPSVKSFSRINEDAKQLLKDAQEMISNSERPISQKTKDFIAKSKDFVLDQFDATPEGFRILQSLLNEEDEYSESSLASPSSSSLSASPQSTKPSLSSISKNYTHHENTNNECDSTESDSDEDFPFDNDNDTEFHSGGKKTNIKYKPLISTRPLPKIWSDSQENEYYAEEPVNRVKLTRAPGMSFSLLMRSDSPSASENESEEEPEEPDSSQIYPNNIDTNALKSQEPSKKSVFQRAALRMSVPMAQNLLSAGKMVSDNSSNSNLKLSHGLMITKKSCDQSINDNYFLNGGIHSNCNNKKEPNTFSFSSGIPTLPSSTITNTNLNIPSGTNSSKNLAIPSRTESNDVYQRNNSMNSRFLNKKLTNLPKKSTSTPINFVDSDSSLNSDEKIQLNKISSCNNANIAISLKSKFAEQMTALKKMGFNDENIILQALNETNGNVQLAAQLLRNKFS
ncbi:hypothetical protein M9Y10_038311 [Tritrichomonas musculus]|uniref:Ubiquitin-like protein 7 n=1 Tax=Tritrichomonas musculus TaxID=1915356 RepID=A0ABR2K815_9EUKA